MAKTATSGSSRLISYLGQRRELLDRHLGSLLEQEAMPDILRSPAERVITSRGKRLRGVLTLAVGEACGGRSERILDAAAAVEMIHASSLIIDDLPSLDDAELRRGEPTLHRSCGEDRAILTAVALLNHSYGLISRNYAALTPRRWSHDQLMQTVVKAVGWDGTIGGEAVDLHSEDETLDFQSLEYIHSRKTGALFVASAAVGAMLANGSHAVLRAVEAYAKNLGLAYQITDDILDVTSTAEALGKDVRKDEGKLTFVRLAGLEGARQLADELIETSIQAISTLGARSERLRDLAIWTRDREQ